MANPFTFLFQYCQLVGRNRWLLFVAAALLVILSCLPATEFFFAPLDRIFRQSVAAHAIHKGPSQAAVILVDKKSVDELGVNKCFAYSSHVDLLKRLHDAASVVFDFTMPCIGANGGALAHEIRRHGRVVLPVHVSPEKDIALFPAQQLEIAAAAIGQRSIIVGSDHLIQGISPYVMVPGTDKELPHVVLEAIRLAGFTLPFGGVDDYIQDNVSSLGHVKSGVLSVFLPPRIDIDRYSYIDVLRGTLPDSTWQGRILFIGDGVSDSAGTFNLSSDPGTRVKGSEANAMIVEALLDGHILRRSPLFAKLAVSIVTITGMLAICIVLTGWRMYAVATAWLMLFVLMQLAALLHWGYWLSPSVMIAACFCVFALCGWGRAYGLRSFLADEYVALKEQMAVSSAGALVRTQQDSSSIFIGDQGEIEQVMQQIWGLQSGYIEMIEMLPYAVFVEEREKLVLQNEKGKSLLDSLGVQVKPSMDSHPSMMGVRQAIIGAKVDGAMRSFERELNGRVHMVIVTPFSDGERYASDASMICVVDIHDIRSAAENDRLTMRHMAHDLRSPLATVLSLLEERLKANAMTDPSFFSDIHKLVDYSLRVAQDFTQLSRVGHLDPGTYVLVSVNDIVTEAIDQAWHVAAAKQIDIDGSYTGDDVFMRGNRDMLLRTLANLLDNAIKYSDNGTAITVTISILGGEVAISVHDQGVGIPEQDQQRLFEPFFQVQSAHRDSSQGVGLGLAFVMAVIDQHGGTVNVESAIGSGSCFTVSLPIMVRDSAEL